MQLTSAVVAKAMPYLMGGSLIVGLALGGWLGWSLQGGKVARAKAEVAELEARIERGRAAAAAAAREAELTIGALSTDLAHARRLREVEYVEVVREIEKVSSRERQCLGPATRGVLHRSDRAAVESEDPRQPARASPGPAADPGGPAGASEQAVALWIEAARNQYRGLQRRFHAVSDAVRALPCVEVVP